MQNDTDASHPLFDFCDALLARDRSTENSDALPYLRLGGARPVHLLSVQPWAEFDDAAALHRRDRDATTYREFADLIGATAQSGDAARTVERALALARHCGGDGVLWFHCLWRPHAARRGRDPYATIAAEAELTTYAGYLRDYLCEKDALAIANVPPRATIDRHAINDGWPSFLASLIGFDAGRFDCLAVRRSRKGNISCALYVSRVRGRTKAVCCMTGPEALPTGAVLERLAGHFAAPPAHLSLPTGRTVRLMWRAAQVEPPVG